MTKSYELIKKLFQDEEYQKAAYPLLAADADTFVNVRYRQSRSKGDQSLKNLTAGERNEVLSAYRQEFSAMTLEQMKEEQINEIKMTQVSENRREAVILIVMSIIAVAVVCVSLLLIRRMSSSLMTQFGDEMEEQQARMIEMQQRTIEGMADLVESRDELTGDHVKSTAYYAGIIAGQLLEDGHYTDEIDENYIQQLVHFAPLHDMGKIVVSDNILLKPGKLTEEEFEQMKLHASMGGQIIRSILDGVEAPWHVEMACNIATHHHERWDGHGYPDGLSQMQIPLCARIMSVADVFDALISPRIYKPAFSLEQSYDIIQEGAGKQFDPVIVEAFMKLRPRIDRYLQEKEEKLEKSS